MHSSCIKVGRRGDAAALDKREVVRQHLHRSRNPVPACAAQFNKIVTRGEGDEEAPFVAQDTAELLAIRPPRNRHCDRERTVGIRHKAIGIGDDPFTSGVGPRRQVNCRSRDVNTMCIEADLPGESTEVETLTAACIENGVARRCGQNLRDRV